ncbi:MAG TPA: FAD-binding protein [Miltoncostaeaceae bacterium]|nr:FAD-binding protein [Miltoncostaeaceae bacterium]
MTTMSVRTVPASVVLPGDDGWDEARQAWNAAVDQMPAAVAQPTSVEDVVEAIRWARAHGMRVAPQSTGHNAGPLGDLSDTMLLRTGGLDEVSVDLERGVARAGGGVLWEQVVDAVAPHGMAVLHGSSPDVGVSGYSLGGGIGWLARLHGLATNSLTAVELVTMDGEHLRADADTHPDLFWAIRGGGGNFGVVTALEFRMYPLESAYAGWLIFPWERSEEVLNAWAAWTRTAPDEVTSVGRILQLPDMEPIPPQFRGAKIVVVEAAFAGSEADGAALMAPLRALGPIADTFAQVPPQGLVRLHQDPEGRTPGHGDHTLLDRLTPEAVRAFVATAGPGSNETVLSAEIRHLGGALARPEPGNGALSHLDASYAMFAVGIPFTPEVMVQLQADTARIVAALEPWSRGRSYLNFAESSTDTRTAYAPGTYARLQEVKARYDASGTARANHPIRMGA